MKDIISEDNFIHKFSLEQHGFEWKKELVGGCIYEHPMTDDFRILWIDSTFYAEYHGQTIYNPLKDMKHLQVMFRVLFDKQLRRRNIVNSLIK